MNNYSGMIIDVLVIALITFFVIVSAKKGFVRTVIEVVGLAAALILSAAVSKPVADLIYNKTIEPSLIEAVSDMNKDAAGKTAELSINNLPGYARNYIEKNDTLKSFNSELSKNIENGTQSAVKGASQKIIKPIFTRILSAFIGVILFVILMIVVLLLAKVVNKLFSFSFIGKINRLLGGITGLFKGLLIAVLVCSLINLIVTATGKGFLIFTPETVNEAGLFKALSCVFIK